MSVIAEHLLGGLRLLAGSTVFYVTTPLLLIAAAVPAALRTYQLYSGNDDGWLELLVESLRVVLIALMIAIGRSAAAETGSRWAGLGTDIARTVRAGWLGILIQLAVVTGIVLLANAAVESIVTRRTVGDALAAIDGDPSSAAQTALAVIFAVKNILVIPVYVAAMLMACGAIRR